MHNLRWVRLLYLLIICFSTAPLASTVYSSPTLNEASSLVDIVPKKSKQLASNFLTQRKLSDQTEKSPSSISRDETDSRIRTPGGTIDALKILADAEYNLGNPHLALKYLAEAKQLTETYHLPYLNLDVQLHEIRMQWLQSENAMAARERLAQVEEAFTDIKNPEQLALGLKYQINMLKAEIASKEGNFEQANRLFSAQKSYVEQLKSSSTLMEYHLTVGRHLLHHKKYNKALSEFLSTYWKAVEENAGPTLAKVNRLLGELFYDRRVYDKANDYFSQAADFYDNYEDSPMLPPILKRMGDINYHQAKYNLALVHYFNALDHEKIQNNIENIIDLRIALAATYLKLVNYPLAEQYLDRANDLLEFIDIPKLKAYALLLESGLAVHKKEADRVIINAQQALEIANKINDLSIQKSAFQLMHHGYELNQQYDLALKFLKQYTALSNIEQQQLDIISEDAFRQQKEFVEQTLHLAGQKAQLENANNEYHKFQKIAFGLFVFSTLLFIILLRRGHILRIQKTQLTELNEDLFTHSRSGLRNLRMLIARLPASLEATSDQFEKWHVGELIHEPLNDRLRFVMIDVPFLRNMYLQHGYKEGLKLEKAFGDYLKQKVESPARIYHFSDANLLYIEPSNENNDNPEVLFNKIQQWILDFRPRRTLNRIVRIGMADYPFLPRAYTAINDKELLDILLMSTGTARTLSMKEQSSQWVYLKAIENAPAASLATGDIRNACKHSINQGLIKVHSSYNNEENIKKLLKDE